MPGPSVARMIIFRLDGVHDHKRKHKKYRQDRNLNSYSPVVSSSGDNQYLSYKPYECCEERIFILRSRSNLNLHYQFCFYVKDLSMYDISFAVATDYHYCQVFLRSFVYNKLNNLLGNYVFTLFNNFNSHHFHS